MSFEAPINAHPLPPPPPPPISESSTSALPTHPKSTSDVSTPSKRMAPKNSSFASTPAKKNEEEEHEKEKSTPKKAAHKSHTLSCAGKEVASALPPLQRVQPDIVAPSIPELMVLSPIELVDLSIQQLEPPISKASVATRPKSPVEAAYAILVLVIPNVDISAMDDATSTVRLGLEIKGLMDLEEKRESLEEEIRLFVRSEMSQHCGVLPNYPSTQPFQSVNAQVVPVLKLSHAEEEEGDHARNVVNINEPEYEYFYTEDSEEGLEAHGTESPMLRDEIMSPRAAPKHGQQKNALSEQVDICALPLDEGDCNNYTLKWYYNQRVAECRPFIYSGCRGNHNRFDSREACEHQCKPQASANG
ncbi:UNVERIFIED_CONTAM: hypothetical protein K2H54_050648 [Gekko kuhli]